MAEQATASPSKRKAAAPKEPAARKLHHTAAVIDASDADLAGSVFVNVDLSRTRFRDVRFTDAVVENAELVGLQIFGTNLAGVVISGCRLDDMTIDGVRVSDLFEAYEGLRETMR